MSESTLQYIFRSAMGGRQNVWIECEALDLLESLSPTHLQTVLEKRMKAPQGGDAIFVRRRAVRLVGSNLARRPSLAQLFPRVAADPSPYVRQALPRALRFAEAQEVLTWLNALAVVEASPQVRAAAILEVCTLLEREELFDPLLDLMAAVLEREEDPFVLHVDLKVSLDGLVALKRAGRMDPARLWATRLTERIEHLHGHAGHLPVRRWAAQTRERIWVETDPQADIVRQQLLRHTESLPPGKRRRLPGKVVSKADPTTLGRVLSVLSQEDYGYDLQPGLLGATLTRIPVWGFRWRRFLHEVRNPSPDKRQGFLHTIGRRFQGTVRAPSAILAELTQTKVPGEPLLMTGEAGWRPYLPLVDEVLSGLERGTRGRPVQIFTSEGITEITPPRFFLRR